MSTSEITNRFPMIVAGAVLSMTAFPGDLTPKEAVRQELVRLKKKLTTLRHLARKAPTLVLKVIAADALKIAAAEYNATFLAQFDIEDAVKHLTGN